ncbi:MAG: hypothetical protein HY741_08955 [Chloroflexi bacterium]|nr:hypothetical protein [Chloroflexota bacterium]
MQIELPGCLRDEFERRARQVYAKDSVARALVEAIELWLAQHRENLIEPERAADDQAYALLAAELERNHAGKWAVIAHGKLQGVGDSIDQVAALATTARDRLIFQVGATRPPEVEFGWH